MLKKIELPPGINKESTQYAAAGAWYDANNVRFRRGSAEVIGGWVRDGMYELQGVGRAAFSSRDYSANNYQFIATDWKFYVVTGEAVNDITPVRETNSGTSGLSGVFATVDGDPNIIVTDAGHGLAVNDWVAFSGVTGTVGGVTAEELNQTQGFQVSSVKSAGEYTLYLVDWETGNPILPGSTASGGGGSSIIYYYKVSSGLSTQVLGNAWGAGAWGGEGTPTSYDLPNNPLLGIGVSTSGRLTNTSVGTVDPVVGGSIYLKGLDSSLADGVKASVFNNNWWDVFAVGAGSSFDITTSYTFAIGSAGGGSGATFYVADADGVVTGATRGWNDSSTDSILTGSLRRVHIDNYGEDVMFNNSGGPIYYWDISASTTSGIPTGTQATVAKVISDDTAFTGNSGTPDVVDSFLISKKDGHCVALGCNDIGDEGNMNSLLVRWSDQNNPFDWTPSTTNTSGGQVLRVGSKIMGGVSTKDEVVIFTDAGLYSMRFVGPPDVFGFSLITEGVEIVSPLAAVNAANTVFFMGNDGFYAYSGSVSPLPSSVSNYVFDDFNFDQKEKCFAASNSAFSEVIWFYPSGPSTPGAGDGSFEPNRYVMFNYEDSVWSIGSFDMSSLSIDGGSTSNARTAWRDAIVFQNPMSSFLYNYAPSTTATNLKDLANDYIVPLQEQSAVMIHETGTTAQNSGLDAYLESGEVDISDGERLSFYSRLIPDLQVFNSTNDTAEVSVTLNGRDFPGDAQSQEFAKTIQFTTPVSSSTYTPVGNSTAVRGRARSMSMKVSSNATTFQWRLGKMRLDLQPDGRR